MEIILHEIYFNMYIRPSWPTFMNFKREKRAQTSNTNGCKSQFLRHFGKDDYSGYDLKIKTMYSLVAKRIRTLQGVHSDVAGCILQTGNYYKLKQRLSYIPWFVYKCFLTNFFGN